MTYLLWAPVALATLGVYLLTRLGLAHAVELGRALRIRLQRAPSWMQRVASPDATQEATFPQDVLQRQPVLWGLGGGLALGLLWHHPVLTPWFVVLGGAAGWMLSTTRSGLDRSDLKALGIFVTTLQSTFTVGQSVFIALEVAAEDLGEGPLREAVQDTVRRYRADADVEEALDALRRVGWPQLNQLADVLGRLGQADEDAAREALDHVRAQLRRSRQLRDRAQTVLTLTKGTLRVLQVANLAAVAAATALPMWRQFYDERPLMLVAATAMVLMGSWYFAGELKRMEGLL